MLKNKINKTLYGNMLAQFLQTYMGMAGTSYNQGIYYRCVGPLQLLPPKSSNVKN